MWIGWLGFNWMMLKIEVATQDFLQGVRQNLRQTA